jgi:hypothetical protein
VANKELKSCTIICSCTQKVPDIGEKRSDLDPGPKKHGPAALYMKPMTRFVIEEVSQRKES